MQAQGHSTPAQAWARRGWLFPHSLVATALKVCVSGDLSQFCTSWPRAIDRPGTAVLLSGHHPLPLRMRGNKRSKWLHTLLWEGVPEGSQPRMSNDLSKLDHE